MYITLLTKTFTDNDIIEFYKTYGHLFSERSNLKDILREILEFFLSMVYYFAKGITSFFENFFTLNSFFKYAGVNELYEKILIIIPFVVILSILIATIKNLAEMKANTGIFKNAFLSLLIIFSLPIVMQKTGETLDKIINSIDKNENKNAIDEIYKECYLDLDYNFVQKNFENINLEKTNTISTENIGKIKINELLLDGRSPKHEILKYRIKNEKDEIEKISANKGYHPRILWDGYYRWKINFGYGIVFLLVTILVYFKTSLGLANIYYNLAAHKILGGLLIATDVEDDYRKKLVLKEIFTGYISIIALYLSMKIFKELSGYINTLDANFFVKIFLILGGYVGMTKSTMLVEQSFGVNNINNSNPIGSIFRTIFFADRLGRMFGGSNKNTSINDISKDNQGSNQYNQNNFDNSDYDDNKPLSENAEEYDNLEDDKEENYNNYEDFKNYDNWENEDKEYSDFDDKENEENVEDDFEKSLKESEEKRKDDTEEETDEF